MKPVNFSKSSAAVVIICLLLALSAAVISCGGDDSAPTGPPPVGDNDDDDDDDDDDTGGEAPVTAAFAGCEGWGCDTEGGRGGDLYIITSTEDSGTGTLREALEATGKRFIITQVDGIIRLETFIRAGSGEVTLDLRKPPGGGLTIANKALVFQGISDVIVLGVRYRGTDSIPEHGVNAATVDCIGFTSVQQAVVGYSSFYGCADEAVSIERASAGDQINSEITIQNNLFLEGCMIDCQAGQGHARPINLSRGWNNVAIHHNAFFGNERRQPQAAGCVGFSDCDGTGWPLNPVTFVGYNLITHWLEQATQIKNGAGADIIGNVYIPGNEAIGASIEILDDSDLQSIIYLDGNRECDTPSDNCGSVSVVTAAGTVSGSRLTDVEVKETPSDSLITETWIRTLGPPVWDEEDERVLQQYLEGDVTIGGNYDPNSYVPPAPAEGSVEDSDRDGIPDGLDPEPDTFSAWKDSNDDDWSDLEAFLNGLEIQ